MISRGKHPGSAVEYADIVIAGGGAAGAAVAGLLVEADRCTVALLEAGPDPGSFACGRWPAALLDATTLPTTHDWGLSGPASDGRTLTLERGRVIGGSSATNGCALVRGARADYDAWAAATGDPDWCSRSLEPLFDAVERRLRSRTYEEAELGTYARAWRDGAAGVDLPVLAHLNDFDDDVGVAPSTVNVVGGTRWNAAFAYLDPVRERSNLTIHDNTVVDRVVHERGQVQGVVARRGHSAVTIETSCVILAGGAYGSPAMLMRSGIGPEDGLRSAGIAPLHVLDGVGGNLRDHPTVVLHFAGSERLRRDDAAFVRAGFAPEEQIIAKARSQRCREAFDLHLFPVAERTSAGDESATRWTLYVAAMDVRSRGRLRLLDADPERAPHIDHGYLSDEGGADIDALIDGVRLGQTWARQPETADVVGAQVGPGVNAADDDPTLRARMRAHHQHYWHPAGTCAMGRPTDPAAVVDATGRVHGIGGLYVADASIMPTLPRANTHLPTLVVAERIARSLIEAEL